MADNTSRLLRQCMEQVKQLKEELRATDDLLQRRDKLLAKIPECPVHGAGCVPHAMQWVDVMLELIAAEDVTYITPEAHQRRQEAWRAARAYNTRKENGR